MKKIVLLLAVTSLVFVACNRTKLGDPNDVNPESESLPADMELKNDSVIVPRDSMDHQDTSKH